MNFVYFCIILCGLIYVLYKAIFYISIYVKQNRINMLLLEECNPEKYIKEIDKISVKYSYNQRDILEIKKAIGYIYMGQFNIGINNLKEIGVEKLTDEHRESYYKILLLGLLLSENIEEGNKIFYGFSNLFTEKKEWNELNENSLMEINALYNFYNGKIDESKQIFIDLLTRITYAIHKATANYFLGLIEYSKGKPLAEIDYFDEALKYSNNTFVTDRIKLLKKNA